MCDYSRYTFPNRLARKVEDLVAHRFTSGCMGFAAAEQAGQFGLTSGHSWLRQNWPLLRSWFLPPHSPSPTAVCIPPRARLQLQPVAPDLRQKLALRECEDAILTHATTAEFRYRDGLRFRNGEELSLQLIPVGQRIRVGSFANSIDESESQTELVGATGD